jgi:hypothetical protein
MAASRAGESKYELARQAGRLLCARGFRMITGGLGGIMVWCSPWGVTPPETGNPLGAGAGARAERERGQ